MQSDSQKRLARRASIKELSNKAEGIYYYIKPQNMLFRLISAGNELASAINGAVAYFTNFAQSAPQPRFTDGQLVAIPEAERYNADSAVFSDTDDLPF